MTRLRSTTGTLLAGCVGTGALALTLYASAWAATGKVVIEAEKADKVVEHFAIKSTNDKLVPSGKYVVCPPGSCGKDKVDLRGEASYTIKIPETGAYYLWVRSLWENGCGNSVAIQIDGQPAGTGDHKGVTVGEDGTYGKWAWRSAKKHKFLLKAGTHKLVMYVTEDGVQVDQILLTKDKDYVPVRAERPTQ